jgi:charged multivesicular body protein 6
MGRSASKPAPPTVSPHDKAVLELKVQRDKLKRYQKQLQAVLDRETELARRYLAQNDKKRALLALKKKRYQESLLEKSDSQLVTIEQLVDLSADCSHCYCSVNRLSMLWWSGRWWTD